MKFFATVLLTTALPIIAFAQSTAELEADLTRINAEIAEAALAAKGGGVIGELAKLREQALLVSRSLAENRIAAEKGEATVEVTVPAMEPQPKKVEELSLALSKADAEVAAAEVKVKSLGGLVQILAMTELATVQLERTQLRIGLNQARFGIPFPKLDASDVKAADGTPEASDATEPTTRTDGEAQAIDQPTWADPDYPDIEYAKFKISDFDNTMKFVGMWLVREQKAAVDDSPIVVAQNVSAHDFDSFASDLTALMVRCIEGEAAVIMVQDDFLLSDFQNNTLPVTYRIADEAAVNANWSVLTNNMGAGLFGVSAQSMMRELLDKEKIFIRVTERNGQNHDATLDLRGYKKVAEKVSGACRFPLIEMTSDQYRAIQSALNAAGYDAGEADGQWGRKSADALMEYQKSKNLDPTGVPNEETLTSMAL